jgi:hypothetical protein
MVCARVTAQPSIIVCMIAINVGNGRLPDHPGTIEKN